MGTSLVAWLETDGHDVRVVSRKQSSRDGRRSDLIWDASRPWTGEVPTVNLIVHLAGPNGDEVSEQDIESGLERTRRVIDLCQQIRSCDLIYFSTFQVFGRWDGLVTDKDKPIPNNAYGRGHLLGESLVKKFGSQYERRVGILRPTNIFGVNSNPMSIRWHRVPADFCMQAVRDSRIVINGDPNECRDFLPVESLARRVGEFVRRRDSWDGVPRIIGSGKGFSLKYMADLVAREAGRKFGIEVAVVSARKADGQPRHLVVRGENASLPFLVSHDGVDLRESVGQLLIEAQRRIAALDGRSSRDSS